MTDDFAVMCQGCGTFQLPHDNNCWKCGQPLRESSTAAPDEAKGGSLERACCAASGVEAEVCADIAARQQRGIQKYGMTVAENPLSLEQWLQHAYEECLDQAIYLKKAIAVTKQHNDPSSPTGGVK